MQESKIIKIGETANGEAVELDLYKFIKTRALVQASSGGGKSWLVRVIAEKTLRSRIPVWIVDPEGEYVTLREKFEVVIFGADDADLPADKETLQLVLPELYSKNISCVFDLSESGLEEKQETAAHICRFLLSVPKDEQKPLLVAIDEAHILAPEREATDSVKAIADLASRGRKRALGLIVASQRLSNLNKNLTTQLNNRFVGFCREDIEIKRSGELVGRANAALLQEFDPGDFFAVGGALSSHRRVVRFHSASVETTHPDSDFANFSPFAQKPVLTGELAEMLSQLRAKLTAAEDSVNSIDEKSAEDCSSVEKLKSENEQLRLRCEELNEIVAGLVTKLAALPAARDKNSAQSKEKGAKSFDNKSAPQLQQTNENNFRKTPGGLSAPQSAILNALRTFEALGLESVDRSNVAVIAGASPRSSAFANNLGYLRNEKNSHNHPPLVEYLPGKRVKLTAEGKRYANAKFYPTTLDALHEAWCRMLPAKQAAILRVLIEVYPGAMARSDIADLTDQSPTSSAFANNLGRLRGLGLIDYGTNRRGGKTAFATKLLFPGK